MRPQPQATRPKDSELLTCRSAAISVGDIAISGPPVEIARVAPPRLVQVQLRKHLLGIILFDQNGSGAAGKSWKV
jgi:hypothetical protein